MIITTEKILLDYDPEIKNLLPALKKISAVFGYISESDAEKTAGYFKTTLTQVYETASFYDLVNTKKQPSIVIKICGSVNCATGNSFKIINEIENYFRIKSGDDNNPKIKLEIISCLERCGEGPVVVVNDKIYTNVTKSSMVGILGEWA